jgi:hypothetical protein
MLKQFLTISTFLLITAVTTSAQTKPADSNPAKDSVLNKMCDCISENKNLKTPDDASEALQACMMKVIEEDPIGVLMDLGLEDFEDQEKAEQFGQALGLELIKKCPKLRSLISEEMVAGMQDNKAGLITGKLVRLESDVYQFIVVDDGRGTQSRLLWLRPFKNSEQFIQQAANVTGKNITVKWKEVEVYNPKSKSYNTFKEIMEINL